MEAYFGGRPTNSSLQETLNVSRMKITTQQCKTNTNLKLLQFLSDATFNYAIRQTQKWHARYATASSPVYLYYFDFDGLWNINKKFLSLSDLSGKPCFASDLRSPRAIFLKSI